MPELLSIIVGNDIRVKQWNKKDFVTYISLIEAFRKGCMPERAISKDECVDTIFGLQPAEFDALGDGTGYHLGLRVYIPLSAIIQETDKYAPDLVLSKEDVIDSISRIYNTSWRVKKRKPYLRRWGRIISSFCTAEYEDGTIDKLYDLDAEAFDLAVRSIRYELVKAKIDDIEVITTKHGAVKAWRFKKGSERNER